MHNFFPIRIFLIGQLMISYQLLHLRRLVRLKSTCDRYASLTMGPWVPSPALKLRGIAVGPRVSLWVPGHSYLWVPGYSYGSLRSKSRPRNYGVFLWVPGYSYGTLGIPMGPWVFLLFGVNAGIIISMVILVVPLAFPVVLFCTLVLLFRIVPLRNSFIAKLPPPTHLKSTYTNTTPRVPPFGILAESLDSTRPGKQNISKSCCSVFPGGFAHPRNPPQKGPQGQGPHRQNH